VPRTSRIYSRNRTSTPPRATAKRPGRSGAPAATPDATAARPAVPQGRTKPQTSPDEGYVAVGRVLAPFGLLGELKVQALTDNPRRFAPKAKLWAGMQPVSIAKMREAQGYVYLMLKGFNDRTSVERFRHAILQVPESSLPPLEEGEYYRFQLIGLRVVTPDGAQLGTLDEIIETGANDVYRVRTSDGADVLLPARADVILSINLDAGEMLVDPPAWR
jgi:16S rRNA processing protein RimM